MAVDKILILALIWSGCVSCCQFPGEIQGMFSTQALSSHLDSSSAARTLRDEGVPTLVTIDHSSISTWGNCVARHKQYYILSQRFSRGGPSCYRCVHLLVASPLVVVATSRKDERCFPSVEEAKESCSPIIHHHTNHHVEPGDQSIDHDFHQTYDHVKLNLELIKKDLDQIILYKVKSAHDEKEKIRVECPIRGVFAFTYEKGGPGVTGGDSRRQREVKCPHPTSEMTNCPYGSGMNLIYRDCSIGQPEQVELECLGGWKGSSGVRYLTVQDKSVRVGDTRPKFRCGMYREDASSGLIHLAFSKDSTCDNMLSSPIEGYETYTLTAVPAPPLPTLVIERGCRFPPSLQGEWGSTTVGRDTIQFKDERTLKRYKAVCVEDTGDGEHFVVYSRSQCGDPTYNCLWLKRRSANILEFMLGLQPNESYAHSSLCHSDMFGAQNSWVTVAKTVLDTPTRCPVVGRFVGELPDASGYCGRLQSHCNRPDVMTYTVTECGNAASAYEQREYRCLGEWREGGKTFALTYRLDTHTHECFVGVEMPDGRVFIKEADGGIGGSCGRTVKPEKMGMELQQRAECSTSKPPVTDSHPPAVGANREKSPSPSPPPRTPGRPPWQRGRLDATTKPWKPITAPPRRQRSNGESTHSSLLQVTVMMMVVRLLS